MSAKDGKSSRQMIPGVWGAIDPDQVCATDSSLGSRATPDIHARLARIALLQHAIRSGTYHVPSAAVAEKVVERMIQNPVKSASGEIRTESK